MRIVLTGGGTGGHIYPALAIGDKIREKEKDAEFLYIGDKNCMESEIVPKAGYEFRDVPAEEVHRDNVLKLFKTGIKNLRGIVKAKKIMKEFRPDAVIGTGGFVSFPVIYAGHLVGAKCFVHEENAFPGLACKALEKYSEKVTLGFEAAVPYFKDEDKLVVTGNPVRGSFTDIDKKRARRELGIGEDDFVVLAFGGSLGAERINEVVTDVIKDLSGETGITILFGTGKTYYDGVMSRIKGGGFEPAENIVIKPYIDDMDLYLGASDLVISRSGALTLAETGVAGKASILVPSPNVTGNHQYHNAKAVADKGGAVLIEEKDLERSVLEEEIRRLRDDRDALAKMGEIVKEMSPGDASDRIYEVVKAEFGK